MDTLQEQLTQLLPTSIDDIIRANRDKAELHFSLDEEINPLFDSVPDGRIKARITGWAFITMHIADPETNFVYLVGFNQSKNCSWMTSYVTGIGNGKVSTAKGSIYALVGDSTQDIDLLHVCATLHLWGMGRFLGVPHIFY